MVIRTEESRNEDCLSLKFSDFAVTGNAKRWKKCNSKLLFDDILVFGLTKKGNVKWWRYYDVQKKVSNKTNNLIYFLIS